MTRLGILSLDLLQHSLDTCFLLQQEPLCPGDIEVKPRNLSLAQVSQLLSEGVLHVLEAVSKKLCIESGQMANASCAVQTSCIKLLRILRSEGGDHACPLLASFCCPRLMLNETSLHHHRCTLTSVLASLGCGCCNEAPYQGRSTSCHDLVVPHAYSCLAANHAGAIR